MRDNEIIYSLSLCLIPGIGTITARKLLQAAGSATVLFEWPAGRLEEELHIPAHWVRALKAFQDFETAARELQYCRERGIEISLFTSPEFPPRLKELADGPVFLFSRGKLPEIFPPVIAIVGTRSPTDYGRAVTQNLVEELADIQPVVLSGLAHGIDRVAHMAALDNGLSTWAVMGNGFRFVYPAVHRVLAQKIAGQGCLVSEFFSDQKPDKENFPKRNRIIAGLADALVVVEAAEKGGALISARLAAQYNREVFAVPGRSVDKYSKGCNALIKSHAAVMIENAADLKQYMGWGSQTTACFQPRLLLDLSPREQALVGFVQEKGEAHIETLCEKLQESPAELSALLFDLELKGIISRNPGSIYRMA